MYCNKHVFIPSKNTPHVDDRRGHGMSHRIRKWYRERGHDVAVLAGVSKRWQACLKKHLVVMPAEIARLEAHKVFLKDARDRVYNHRVSRFGEPYRSDY